VGQLQSRVDRNGVERVLPQPRTPKPEPEPAAFAVPNPTVATQEGIAATAAATEPEQVDLEDYPGVRQPQPPHVDRSHDWIHAELKAAVTAMANLPDPATTVARYPIGVGYTLPIETAEQILDWWAEFVPLWADRCPEFRAHVEKITRYAEERLNVVAQ
jgi:hypothetical protein